MDAGENSGNKIFKQGKVVTIVKPYVDFVQIFKERGEVLGVQWISNAYDTQQNLQIS